MSKASFNGDFRSRPQQNFGGASRNLHRDQLLQNAAQERRQREELRKNNLLALKLQSRIRGCQTRSRVYQKFRNQYDKLLEAAPDDDEVGLLTIDSLNQLVKRLTIFYSFEQDAPRIIALLSLIHRKIELLRCDPTRTSPTWPWRYWLRRLTLFYTHLYAQGYCDHLGFNCQMDCLLKELLNVESPNAIPACHIAFVWQALVVEDRYYQLIRKATIKSITAANITNLPLHFEFLYVPIFSTSNIDQQATLMYFFVVDFLIISDICFFYLDFFDKIRLSLPTMINADCLLKVLEHLETSTLAPKALLMSVTIVLCFLNRMIGTLDEGQFQEYVHFLKIFQTSLARYFRTIKDVDFSQDFDEDNFEYEHPHEYEHPRHIESRTSSFLTITYFVRQFFESFNKMPTADIAKFVKTDKNLAKSIAHLGHAMLVFNRAAIHRNQFLHSLAFSSNFLQNLWQSLKEETLFVKFDPNKNAFSMLAMSTYFHLTSAEWETFLPSMMLFNSIFNYFLQTLDDIEFFSEYVDFPGSTNTQRGYNYSVLPFTLKELVSMSTTLRELTIFLIELAYQDRKIFFSRVEYDQSKSSSSSSSEPLASSIQSSSSSSSSSSMAEAVSSNYDISCFQRLLQSSLRLLRNLYSRDIRRQYTPDGHWISPKKTFTFGTPANFKFAIQQRGHLYREFLGIRHLNREEISVYGPPIPVKDIVAATVIQELPFVVPFFDRVAIVQSMIAHEKRERENLHYELFANNTVNIRRNFLYEDGFNKLSEEVMPNLKAMIRIKLFSALNMEETGVDGGGVFREFITEIIKTAFDPNLGFFSLTKNGLLYPNPAVEAIEPHSNRHYYFIGRLLGKALYENILTDLPLAPFFLEKLLTTGSDVDINHLASLDPELYKHLISLRNFPGNVADLSLDFTVVTSNLGHNKVIELKPKGGEILVTNENRIEYIHLMADYKLNKQIRNQCTSFKNGFYNVMDVDLVKMFDTNELQRLISGSETPIDLTDLRQHTVYSNGYSADHPVIDIFWKVVSEFDDEQKRKLLKFITSCPRPPLLGFKDLYPSMCIQNAGKNPERLPTASTCMNLLKLPEVYNKETMKEKLLYSINAGAGFELS